MRGFALIVLICFTFFPKDTLSQNLSTEGREFWFGFMNNWLQDENNQIILEVYISADDTTQGVLEMPLIPGHVPEEFEVIPGITKRLTVATHMGMAQGTNRVEPKGIHIITNNDVSVYAMNKRQYSADVAVVLPEFSLGNEYIVMSHWEDGNRNGNDNSDSEFMIVSISDSTRIQITPSVFTEGGNAPGVPFEIMLNRGEIYQVQARADLTGTELVGLRGTDGFCQNFALFAGNQYTKVGQCDHPDGHDHLFQQMYPVKTWGKEYITVNFETRIGGDVIKILASEDETNVFFEGSKYNLAQRGDFIQVLKEGVNSIMSDKPVAVGHFSRSQGCDGTIGDPFFLNISPNEQLLKNITFNAPSIATLQIYAVNIITPTDNLNSITFDSEKIGDIFEPVENSPGFSFARKTISGGNHSIQSEKGFIAYVYGYGFNESFGYPTGAGLTNLKLEVQVANQLGIQVPTDSTCLHDEVVLTPLTEFNFDSFFWNFGDGNTLITTNKDPVRHQYDSIGSYILTITGLNDVGDCAGGNIETEVKVINVINPQLEILGPVSICPNTQTVKYWVEDNHHFENDWSVSGGTIAANYGDSVLVNWGATNNDAYIKLISRNKFDCYGDRVYYPVKIKIQLEPEAPFGPDALCITNATGREYWTYSILASTYDWSIENGEIVGGQGTAEVDVNWLSPGMGKLWFHQTTVTDTVCAGTSEIIDVHIQREPDASVTIVSDKDSYQVGEPIHLTLETDTLLTLVDWFVDGEPSGDSLAIDAGWSYNFYCGGEYQISVLAYDTLDLCGTMAMGSKQINTLSPLVELVNVTNDLEIDSALHINWKSESTDFIEYIYLLERRGDATWILLDSIQSDRTSFFDERVNPSGNVYNYKVGMINENCADRYESEIHNNILLILDNQSVNEASFVWNPYINWNDGVEEYRIHLGIDDGQPEYIAATITEDFVFVYDTAGFDYCFRVKAVEENGNQSVSWSNEVCTLFIPPLYPYNIITPNDDGRNDQFIIRNIGKYPNSDLVITNRYGKVVFKKTGYGNDWEGKKGGNELSTGVYFYVLELNEPRVPQQHIKGIISILR